VQTTYSEIALLRFSEAYKVFRDLFHIPDYSESSIRLRICIRCQEIVKFCRWYGAFPNLKAEPGQCCVTDRVLTKVFQITPLTLNHV
jgi:hypothetical protein